MNEQVNKIILENFIKIYNQRNEDLKVFKNDLIIQKSIRKLSSIDNTNPELLYKFIKRHRLTILILNNKQISSIIPNCCKLLSNNKKQIRELFVSKINTLTLINDIFSANGINFLIIKGISLSKQIDNNFFTRVHTDLDIFINPEDLDKVINLLKSNGYVCNHGYFPFNTKSIRGKYSKYIFYELTFHNKDKTSYDPVDLHWHLSKFHSNLPSFREAWMESEEYYLGDLKFKTLSKKHAFINACANSAKDKWMSLNSLLEIERLFLLINSSEFHSLREIRFIRLSVAASFLVTENKKLLKLFSLKSFAYLYASNLAWLTLCSKRKEKKLSKFRIKNYIINSFHDFLIAQSFFDYFVFLNYFLWNILKKIFTFNSRS